MSKNHCGWREKNIFANVMKFHKKVERYLIKQ